MTTELDTAKIQYKMMMMTPEERYRCDKAFRLLVDVLYCEIEKRSYTPGELRDAVHLACIKYEQMHIRDMFTGEVIK